MENKENKNEKKKIVVVSLLRRHPPYPGEWFLWLMPPVHKCSHLYTTSLSMMEQQRERDRFCVLLSVLQFTVVRRRDVQRTYDLGQGPPFPTRFSRRSYRQDRPSLS